jgi:hypothetical protein
LESSATTAICTAASTRQVVESFVNNFNRGDIQQLDKIVAATGYGFSWYSTDSPGQRINDEAYNRDTLMAYFMKRHDQHERLELQAFHFIATSGNDRGNFEFELTRSADDGLASAAYGGKGAVDCSRVPSTLVVWSMAREPFLRSNLPTYIGVAALLLVVAAGVTTIYWRRRSGVSAMRRGRTLTSL